MTPNQRRAGNIAMVLIGGKITLSYAPRRACADCVLSSARARRVRAAHVLMMVPLGTVEPTRELMPA